MIQPAPPMPHVLPRLDARNTNRSSASMIQKNGRYSGQRKSRNASRMLSRAPRKSPTSPPLLLRVESDRRTAETTLHAPGWPITFDPRARTGSRSRAHQRRGPLPARPRAREQDRGQRLGGVTQARGDHAEGRRLLGPGSEEQERHEGERNADL